MKINNDKKEVKENKELNDKDYLNMILVLEKNLSNNYSNILNEVSNEYLYEDVFEIFEDTKDMVRELYQLLFRNGWITLEEVSYNSLKSWKKIFNNEIDNLVSEK